jgi:hypothetical protein
MSKNYMHKCKGSYNNHDKNHICKIIGNRDLSRVKELVKDSQFFCKNCGRAAHLSSNLCNPSKI